MKNYEFLMNAALETLKTNDDIFVSCVDDLDSWNGYADGFRAYDMCELDDLHYGMKLSEFLEKITSDFDIRDNYFYYSIYGLESCDDKTALYRDNVDEGELLDNLIDRENDLDLAWIDTDFADIIECLANYNEETAADIIANNAIVEDIKAA